jgi:hypothetical protein
MDLIRRTKAACQLLTRRIMESRRSKLSDLGGRTFMRAAKMAEIILLYVMYSAAAASAASAARSDYPVVNVRKLLRLQSEEKIERKNAFAQSRKMEMRAIIMTKKNPDMGRYSVAELQV